VQKTPPGMNRRRLVKAAAATAAVSTLGLPSLVLAEESSSMSAVAPPKGSEKIAIHPFHVNVPEAKQTELRKRISATSWPERENSRTNRKACSSRRSSNSRVIGPPTTMPIPAGAVEPRDTRL
jgi:hypothetical protein